MLIYAISSIYIRPMAFKNRIQSRKPLR